MWCFYPHEYAHTHTTLVIVLTNNLHAICKHTRNLSSNKILSVYLNNTFVRAVKQKYKKNLEDLHFSLSKFHKMP